MTVEAKFDAWPVTASENLTTLYRAVTLAGAIAANTSRAAGVLRFKANSGEQASAVYNGITKVQAGAAVTTLGYPLTITTSGFFIAASSGGAQVGRALAAAASGDLIPAYVDFMTIPAWPGV